MDKFKASFSKGYVTVKDKWTGFERRTRVIVLAAIGVVILTAVILTAILNRTDMVHLARAADRDEAIAIQAALATAGITESRITRDHDVLVLDREHGLALIAMSEARLPRPRANNDIWRDSVNMFSTDAERREAQKQNLQARIESFLREYDQIDHAQVNLHIPQTRNFVLVEGREEARASVLVSLRQEAPPLTSKQIEGIQFFVLNSVPGLELRNITLADNNLNPLIPGEADVTDPNNILVQQQRRLIMEAAFRESMADYARRSLQPTLERVFGEGNYALSVTVDLDFSDGRVVQDRWFAPEGTVRRILEQMAAGGTALEGGPVGTWWNSDIAPNYPTVPDIAGGDEFFLEGHREIDYEISERFEEFYDNGLRINRVGAMVIVNREPMTGAQNTDWTNGIAYAIGAAPESVQFIQEIFAPPPPAPPELVTDTIWSNNFFIWMIAALGLLLIVLLILAITTSSSRRKRLVRARGFAPAADGPTGYLRDDSFQPLVDEHEGFDLPSLLDESETKDVVLKREIREFTRSNPEIIAQLIRTWLRDED